MRIIKKILKIIHFLFVVELLFCFIIVVYFPDQVTKITGYRLYTVMTNSMEPTIPTYSLVLSKLIPVNESIKPGTIVTFEASRFGDDILLTHYFRETQVGQDGKTYYRTQAENVDFYDNYETKRSDIIGEYVYHVPYIGKIFMFLRSDYGYLFYGELAVIMLINKLIQTRWDEKEKLKEATC